MFCSECGAVTGPGPLDIGRARHSPGATSQTPLLRGLWRSISKSAPAAHLLDGKTPLDPTGKTEAG